MRLPPTALACWLLAALAMAGGAAWSGIALVDHLESRRSFCNACHLPDGSPLHERKARLAREQPGLDLTGVHFARVEGGRFACADCHRGAGWAERGHVLLGSGLNTLRYVVGAFREPDALARPIVDAACTGCHAGVQDEGDASRFHGSAAHRDQVTVHCTECHGGHATDAEPAAQARRARRRARRVCGRCHKGDPPAPQVASLLTHYEAALLRRMAR